VSEGHLRRARWYGGGAARNSELNGERRRLQRRLRRTARGPRQTARGGGAAVKTTRM